MPARRTIVTLVMASVTLAALLSGACGSPSAPPPSAPSISATTAVTPRAKAPAAPTGAGGAPAPPTPPSPQPRPSVTDLPPAKVGAPPAELGALAFATAEEGWAGATLTGGGHAILHTADGGRAWTSQLTTPAPVGSIAVAGPAHVWATAGDTLYATTDDGEHWHALAHRSKAAGALYSLTFPSATDGWALAGVMPSQLVHSTDGGATWVVAKAPCGTAAGVSFTGPDQGWLLCAGEGGAGMQPKQVYATTDAGATWATVAATPPLNTPGPSPSGLPAPGYAGGLIFADAHHGYILEGGGAVGGGVLATTDGGGHWTGVAHLPAVSVWEYVDGASFPTAGRGYLTGGTLGATELERTTDGGRTWTQVWPALAPQAGWAGRTQLAAAGRSVWGIGAGNLLHSTDGGATWSVAGSYHGFLGVTPAGQPVFSNNRGQLVIGSRPARPVPAQVADVSFASDGSAWLSAGGRLYRRAAGATTWTPLKAPASFGTLAAASAHQVWAVADGALYHYNGAWTSRAAPPGLRFDAVAFRDALHGAALAYDVPNCGPNPCRTTLYVTADGGAHWTARLVPGVMPTGRRGELALAGTGTILLLTDRGLLRSTDGGATWAYPAG